MIGLFESLDAWSVHKRLLSAHEDALPLQPLFPTRCAPNIPWAQSIGRLLLVNFPSF